MKFFILLCRNIFFCVSLINYNFISSLEGKISTKPLRFLLLLRREIKVKFLVIHRNKNRALTKEAL